MKYILDQINGATFAQAPTVKTRFNRLINTGVIKSIIPIVDFDIISYKVKDGSHNIKKVDRNSTRQSVNDRRKYSNLLRAKKVTINLNCNYCNTPLLGKMYTFKFANLERFFCCKECRLAYKKRYAARIRAITKRYRKLNRR